MNLADAITSLGQSRDPAAGISLAAAEGSRAEKGSRRKLQFCFSVKVKKVSAAVSFVRGGATFASRRRRGATRYRACWVGYVSRKLRGGGGIVAGAWRESSRELLRRERGARAVAVGR